MNSQEKITFTIEDQILVTPDTMLIKVSLLSEKLIKSNLFEGMNLLTKKNFFKELKKLNNIKHIKKEKRKDEKLLKNYLSTEYIEIYNLEDFNKLEEKILSKTVYNFEKIKVKNIEKYEENLMKILIEKSKIEAQKKSELKNKILKELISYKEIENEENNLDKLYESNSDFKSLIENNKFIEWNYKGYFIINGKIVLRKKLEVTYELE